MDKARRHELDTTDATLTDKETAEGYHFCAEFDWMVVGPEDVEWGNCLCWRKKSYLRSKS